ncbi:MAG TPA: MFS transporter [Polyangiaceae bacterium]|nr:MFS transporter [Polyangiaceae bacterium]
MLVAGACAVLGGIVAAHVLLETARDALFLTKLAPSALALVYLAMAGIGALTARADRLVSRLFGRKNALVLGLMAAATGTMLFYTSTIDQTRAFALYLWAGVITTLLTVQFWLAVAQRFTPAQGRRLYGLLSAGGVLGAVLGASAGALLAQQVSLKSLLAASACLHLITACLITAAPPATELPPPPPRPRLREEFSAVRGNGYLVRVGALLQVSVATLLLVDYVFKTVMASRLPPGELGVNLARYYAVMNALALIVQVFVTMQVLQRMGTVLALTLLPLCLLLAGGLGLFFSAALLFALLAKGADGALRFSLHRVSTELLFLPLGADERARVKPLFDSVLSRATQAIVAVAILMAVRMHWDSPFALGLATCVLAVVWILLAWSLRRPYLERFRSALGSTVRQPDFDLLQLDLDSVAVLVEALSSPQENVVISAMGLFEEGGRSNLIPALVLYHPSPRVLERALQILPKASRSDWIPLAERLLTHEDARVRLSAVRALGANGQLDRIDPSAFQNDAGLRASAAFFLARQLDQPSTHPMLAEFLVPDAEPAGPLALLETLGQLGSSRWADVVLTLERLHRSEFDRALPGAMARTRDLRFVPILVNRLARRDGRNETREALAALGTPALEELERALYDRTTQPALRLHIPRAISRFAGARAGDILLDSLSRDLPGALRYKALRGLGKLVASGRYEVDEARVLSLVERNAREVLRFSLHARVLRESRRKTHRDTRHENGPNATLSGMLFFGLLDDKRLQALERTLRLLQLLHPREDLRRVYCAMLTDDLHPRVAAAEILEVISLGYDENLRALLRVVAEPHANAPLESLSEALGSEPPLELATLTELLADEDPLVAALSAAYAAELDHPELEETIQQAAHNNAWLLEGPTQVSR